ncbi:MAG: hypothetical protein WBF79_07935 [Rhodococcus sp. (in: high G+C Gram-positive bacteria)]
MSKKMAVKTMVVGAAATAVVGVIGVASAQAAPDAPIVEPQDSSQVVEIISEVDPLVAGNGSIEQWLASLNTGSAGGAGAVPPAPTDDNTVIIEQTDLGTAVTIDGPTDQ